MSRNVINLIRRLDAMDHTACVGALEELIAQHTEIAEEVFNTVRYNIWLGHYRQKVRAIKIVREILHYSIDEAKLFVEGHASVATQFLLAGSLTAEEVKEVTDSFEAHDAVDVYVIPATQPYPLINNTPADNWTTLQGQINNG